jgi:AcrR family transcriptional regulator
LKQAVNDRRVERTREALFGAFYGLVVSMSYDQLKVEDILRRAGVGRSTFYEHFSSKDELLAASVRTPFATLADAVRERDNTADLAMILEHFWEHRAVAPSLFRGPAHQVCVGALQALIEERFKLDRVGSPHPLILPPPLAALQIAEALLAPITAWVLGESSCTSQVLAQALRRTARAMLEAQRQRALA